MEDLIGQKLRDLTREKNIVLIGAWESGSRAWGMSREDSDYDVRFIYCGEPRDYLSLKGWPETIERMEHPIDMVGWDIRKVLRLALLKGNVQPLEWMMTCPVYFYDNYFCNALREALLKLWEPSMAAWHYHGIAVGHYNKAISKSLVISKRLKALLYAERALYCRDRNEVPTRFVASDVFGRGDPGEAILEAFRAGLEPHAEDWSHALGWIKAALMDRPAKTVPFTAEQQEHRVGIADTVLEKTIGRLQ